MATTKQLDIILVNPCSRTQVYQSLGSKLAAVENPVWAGLMATFCRTKGLSVEIIDAEAEELTPDKSPSASANSIRSWLWSLCMAISHPPRRKS